MDLGKRVISSLQWMMAGRFGGQLITWVITIIVIRILSPQDYGLMAMAMYVIGFLALFEELGLASAIVQRRVLDPVLTRQVFGLLILLNVSLYGALWLLAPAIAAFFGEPALTLIVRIAGLKLLIQVFGVVPDAVLRRAMQFRGKSVVQFLAMATGSVATLVLALRGHGVWSLVYGNLLTAAVRAVGLQYLAGRPVMPSLRFAGISEAIGFGGLVTIDRFLFYLYSQADVFIIGKLLGKEVLGFYSVAMHLAALPMKKIAGLLNEVGFSAFARLQGEPQRLSRHFLKAIRVLSFIAFPVFFGISAVTPEIVGVFLGEKWLAAILPMQLLSLAIPLRLLHTVTPTSLYGIGRADVSVGNSLLASAMMPAAFFVGIRWGLPGVCVAWLLAYPVYFALAVRRGLVHVGLALRDYAHCLLAPLLAAAIMYGAVFGVRYLAQGMAFAAPAELVLLIVTGVASYATVIVALAPGLCREVAETLLSARLASRVTGLIPARLLGPLDPRHIFDRLRTARNARLLRRTLSRLREMSPGDAPDRRLLADLVTGWDNRAWSVDANYLEELWRQLGRTREAVLECGSGCTTLLTAALLDGGGRPFWVLEHSALWRQRCAGRLRDHGLTAIHMPELRLRDHGEVDWYDIDGLDLPPAFDLVICDGPPAATRGGRAGLMDVMGDRLAPGCAILVDDATREGEQAMIRQWRERPGSRLRVTVESGEFVVCTVSPR